MTTRRIATVIKRSVDMADRRQPILCFNMGSSSLKFALYILGDGSESLRAEGEVERLGLTGGRLWVRGPQREILEEISGDFTDHETAIRQVFSCLGRLDLPKPVAVGHRIVHGGSHYENPVRVGPRLLDDLQRLLPFAPLHLPDELRVVEAVASHFPDLPQVACFDTAFHRSMPELAQRFPLPRFLWDEGVRHYGFHGLSYEFIMSVLGNEPGGRVVIAHLGNGASMAAVKNGQPLDTTMGFSPTGGFMMGTRSGDLDPGILLYLMNEKSYDSADIERLVNHESGLLGVSGISADMKTLLERRESGAPADQAIEMFCYQIRKHVGALAAVLAGIDTLVFTGGIGEKAAVVRWSICQGLGHLGIHLDPEQNAVHAGIISLPDSPCAVRVITTNEGLVIARHTHRLTSHDSGRNG